MISTQAPDTNTVGAWLDTLGKTQKDAFLHYVKNSTSDIESYLYARFLRPGYSGSIADLTAWLQEKYPKQDLRKVLLIEIDSLKMDIDNVRQMTLTGMLDHATAATKISVLQKELRSHIQAVRQLTDGIDRRGLLLAGADRCLRELVNSFEDSPTMSDLIDEASIVVRSYLPHFGLIPDWFIRYKELRDLIIAYLNRLEESEDVNQRAFEDAHETVVDSES